MEEKNYPLLPEWAIKVFQKENHKSIISDISDVSTDNANSESMINRKDIIVINFDTVKENHNKKLKSNDAFIVMKEKDKKYGDIVWIEFKNGKLLDENGNLNEDMGNELKEKIYDSINIFLSYILESTDKGIFYIKENPLKYLKDHSIYYLVYNENKNTAKTKMRDHWKKLAGKQNEGLCGFDKKIKNKFRGYLCRDAFAYTPNEFEKILNEYLKNNKK
ncbi:MAG: hypothetical protein K2L10_02985 [Ruminococcus sp.]|nr:hypothetical protein [Ruminococcus sp.]